LNHSCRMPLHFILECGTLRLGFQPKFQFFSKVHSSDRLRRTLCDGRKKKKKHLSFSSFDCHSSVSILAKHEEECLLLETKLDAKNFFHISVEVPSTINEGYHTPGQYLSLRPENLSEGKLYPIATPPECMKAVGEQGENRREILEFLIKGDDETGQALCNLKPGDTIMASHEPAGVGFLSRNDRYINLYTSIRDERDIVMFVSGADIAAIRAILDWELFSMVLSSGTQNVVVFYGVDDASHFPYAERIKGWEQIGIRFIMCEDPLLAAFDNADTSVLLYPRHIAGGERVWNGDIKESIVIASGTPEMIQEISQRIEGLGVPKENLLVNAKSYSPIPTIS